MSEPNAIRPYITRSRACELIIKHLKTESVKQDAELSEALILAWHILLGPEPKLGDRILRLQPKFNSSARIEGNRT